MTAQTITTSVNYDDASIAALVNGDAITINNYATLTCDSDSRWGQQAAVHGGVQISAGKLLHDGTKVWWVPFSSATGTVPSLGTVGTLDVTRGGSAVAEFLGVWTALGAAPLSAGASMPASGFLKLRRKTVDFASSDVLTFSGGATATLLGAGQRGWLHFVGAGASNINVYRQALWETVGDWFELGVTSGSADQTFQYFVADYCNSIWVETASGSGVYEPWNNVGYRWGDVSNRVATDSIRGKFCTCDATGLIKIATRTGTTAGYLPPAGCKVRVPNMHFSNSSSANWTANIVSSRVATVTTNGGVVNLANACVNWTLTFSSGYSAVMTSSSYYGTLSPQNLLSFGTFTDVATGALSAQAAQVAVNFGAYSVAPITFTECKLISPTAATTQGVTTGTFVRNVTFLRSFLGQYAGTTAAGVERDSTTYAVGRFSVGSGNILFDTCTHVNGMVYGLGCDGITIKDAMPIDKLENMTTSATNTLMLFFSSNLNSNITIDGLRNAPGLANVHFGNSLASGPISNLLVKNIGTAASQYDCGTVNRMNNMIAGLSACENVTAYRCYLSNLASSIISDATTVDGVSLTNIVAPYANTTFSGAKNYRIRGVSGASHTTTQAGQIGSHFYDNFQSATESRLTFTGNETSAKSGTKCQFTAGSPNFDGSGRINLNTLGDQVTFEVDYYILGWTGFANAAPTLTGQATTNINVDYQIDTGSGWNGTWKSATGVNLSAETISPTTGFKLKVRCTANVSSANTYLTFCRFTGTTTASAQLAQYALPGSSLTVNGLVANSRVKVTRSDTGAFLVQGYAIGSSITLDIPYEGAVTIEARCASSAPFYQPWTAVATVSNATATNITALQVRDD